MLRRTLALLALAALPLAAQGPAAPYDTMRPRIAARPGDVATLDSTLVVLYDVISGPAGQRRDWDRFRALFSPRGRLVPTGRTPEGRAVLREWSPEEYLAQAGARLERDGFFEREIARRVERYGDVVHVFSTYESRRTASLDEKPFARGINSIQLWFDGARYWIVSIFWQGETRELPIPAEYLRVR